jgi:CoA:oxalate CoA-transferase
VGLVQTVGQYLEHPQVAARDSVVTIDHPTVGPVTVSGVVPRLMDTPGLIETLGAVLGGTTVEDVLERWRRVLDGATTTGETP